MTDKGPAWFDISFLDLHERVEGRKAERSNFRPPKRCDFPRMTSIGYDKLIMAVVGKPAIGLESAMSQHSNNFKNSKTGSTWIQFLYGSKHISSGLTHNKVM